VFLRLRRTWSFHVVVLQRKAKKCTKIYNARAQLLFCSLNFLLGDVLVAVVVVICLKYSNVTESYSFYLTELSEQYHMHLVSTVIQTFKVPNLCIDVSLALSSALAARLVSKSKTR